MNRKCNINSNSNNKKQQSQQNMNSDKSALLFDSTNPIDVIHALCHRRPHFETWAKSEDREIPNYYELITTSKTSAMQLLRQFAEEQPGSVKVIKSIQEELTAKKGDVGVCDQ